MRLSLTLRHPVDDVTLWFKRELHGVDKVGRPLSLSSAASRVLAKPGTFRLMAYPNEFIPGVSIELTLNCTFPDPSRQQHNFDKVESIVIVYSRHGEDKGFLNLTSAETQNISPHNIEYKKFYNPSGTVHPEAVINDRGTSYFQATYPHPAKNSEAWYRCDVHGLTTSGQHAVVSSPVVRVGISDLIEPQALTSPPRPLPSPLTSPQTSPSGVLCPPPP